MTMTKEEKSERMAVRLSPSEAAMLHELAEADGEAGSTVVRQLIRRAHEERFGRKVRVVFEEQPAQPARRFPVRVVPRPSGPKGKRGDK